MKSLACLTCILFSYAACHTLRGRWGPKPGQSLLALQSATFEGIFPVPSSVYHGRRHLGGHKSRILFHHVWKCGGANFCDMAIRNGEAVPDPSMLNPSSRCDAVSRTLRTPKETDLIQANYTFVSWQAPLTPEATAGVRREFALITILRNPLDQALSHFRHAQRDYGLWQNFSAFVEFGLCVASQNVTFKLNGCEQHLKDQNPHWNWWATHEADTPKPLKPSDIPQFAIFRDNQQLRWLEPTDIGMGVHGRPHLSSEDLKTAKARLDLFDEVFILEEFHRRERWRLAKYGWQDLNDQWGSGIHGEAVFHGRSNASAQLSSEVLSRLREIQRWDQELYRHGQELARNQASHAEIRHAQKVHEIRTESLARDVRFWLTDLEHTANSCSGEKLELIAQAKARSPQEYWTDIIRGFMKLSPPVPPFSIPSWPIQWSFSGLKSLDSQNGLFQIDEFLTTEEASDLLRLFDQGQREESHLCPHCNKLSSCTVRRSCSVGIAPWQSPLKGRIASLLGTVGDASHMEELSITRYEPGGFYSDHFDDLNQGSTGNERAATVLIYLNDLEPAENTSDGNTTTGGATFFPDLNVRVKPKRGRAVIFFPTLPDGSKNWKMLHCAEDAQATKWVVQQWVRRKPLGVWPQESSVTQFWGIEYQGKRHLGKPKSRIMIQCAPGSSTDLCGMAVRNGEVVPNFNSPELSGRCVPPTLAEQNLIEANYSFVMWQNRLPPHATLGQVSSQFTWATMLRNPIDQAVSQYMRLQHLNLWANFSAFMEYGLCAASSQDDLDNCQMYLARTSLEAVDPSVFFKDNQQLRWLLPALRKTVLNKKDLEGAKARLELFDEVLIFEEFHARDRFRLARFGWPNVDDLSSSASHAREPWNGGSRDLDQSILSRLRKVQALDFALYQHATAIAKQQAQASVNRRFEALQVL